jgi:oligopeptide transport system permease protein
VYTRTVYGARTSVAVGVLATLGVAVLGSVLGALAGFFGGVWDAILSRITDVFFAIPVVLGGLVLLSVITSDTVWPVIGFIVLLGWPQLSRIARGAVITAQQNDYVQAARALGASPSRLMLRHIAPNAVAPVIVVATIALGTYIALEATLSYLGVGLKPPSVSWGIDISAASPYVRNAPHALLWPSGALAITVLAFIMLGDAVRDALDPKLR